MALNNAEKAKVRYHLGYIGVQPAASIQFGLPRPIQTSFLVESALNNIMVEHEPDVRRIVTVLDTLETTLVESICRLAAKQLGDITMNDVEQDKLEAEYLRWASRLADILGVPLYPYARRFSRGVGKGGAGSIPVVG